MRSFPAMVDMKRTDGEKLADSAGAGIVPSLSDLPDYDYGLCGSFNKESLDKLNLDEDVSVGDYLDLHAFAKVTGIHMKPGSNEIDRVDWCLCHIAVEDEDSEDGEETEDEAA